jgi:GT2 family glycosyltransferase
MVTSYAKSSAYLRARVKASRRLASAAHSLDVVVSPSLDIIIVNWNTGPHLRACLRSIRASDQTGWTLGAVVVVDNASSDGSCDDLDAQCLPLVLMQNEANRGFAAACNQGASGLSSQYLLFLNPDTVLSPDALGRTLSFMGEPAHDDVGICGVRMIDERGAPVLSCARFPTLLTFLVDSLRNICRLTNAGRRATSTRSSEHSFSSDERYSIGSVVSTSGSSCTSRKWIFHCGHGNGATGPSISPM